MDRGEGPPREMSCEPDASSLGGHFPGETCFGAWNSSLLNPVLTRLGGHVEQSRALL